MTDAKRITMNSSQDKVSQIPLRRLKVAFLKSLGKDDFSDIYFSYLAFVVLML